MSTISIKEKEKYNYNQHLQHGNEGITFFIITSNISTRFIAKQRYTRYNIYHVVLYIGSIHTCKIFVQKMDKIINISIIHTFAIYEKYHQHLLIELIHLHNLVSYL